jgi:hypothetical protein
MRRRMRVLNWFSGISNTSIKNDVPPTAACPGHRTLAKKIREASRVRITIRNATALIVHVQASCTVAKLVVVVVVMVMIIIFIASND